jgi:hypothetical protein
MRIGFTGSRYGMTNAQTLHVHMLLGDLKYAGALQASHGMCEGADAQFHAMARALGYFIVGCPGVTKTGAPYKRAVGLDCDLVMPEKPFLVRNRNIVKESDVVIAAPPVKQERWIGSGTWATIRYARMLERVLILLWPDGTSAVERMPGRTTVEDYRELLTNGSPLN